MTMGSAVSFMTSGPATKITNLGALKIVLGVKNLLSMPPRAPVTNKNRILTLGVLCLMHPPLSGDELLYHRFTRRATETVVFDAAESGMTAYCCARYENQKGLYGAWGPVAAAVVP
jgi:hypothetical protein